MKVSIMAADQDTSLSYHGGLDFKLFL